MDEFGGSQVEGPASSIRKRRSSIPRRPRPDIQLFPGCYDPSPLPSTPVSNDAGRISSDETDGDANSGGKMFSLNQCISKGSPATIAESDNPNKKIKDDLGSRVSYGNGGLGDDTYHQQSPTRQLGTIRNGVGNDNNIKKVKLKVGGVTRTIQAKNGSHGASGSGSSTKSSRPSDASRSRQKLTHQVYIYFLSSKSFAKFSESMRLLKCILSLEGSEDI